MFFSSLVSMMLLFTATMVNLTQVIDYEYLLFALGKVILLSIPVLIIGIVVCRGRLILNFLFGLIFGPAIGVLYVIVMS